MDRLYRLYGYMFARPAFYKINRVLFHLALRGLGVLNWQTAKLQGEAALLENLLSNAPERPTLLDVGANEGDYSDLLRTLAPNSEIHAFEPHPETFQRLKRRLSGRGVHCHNFALGSEEGDAFLFDHSSQNGTGHASLNEGVIERIHHDSAHRLPVRVRRLDNFLQESRIDNVFLLKIDVEGGEAEVLKGLVGAISNGFSVDHVQIEFNEMNVVSRVFLEDIANLLPGYKIKRILPRGAFVDITGESPLLRELFAFQNILFSRN